MLGLFNQTTLPALEQTVRFAQKRQKVLAGNIANMDTPGYRSRDLDVKNFRNALAESIDAVRDPQPSDAVSMTTRDDLFYGPRDPTEQIVFHDGNDVSMEHQITQISKNQHMHNMAITTMRNQFELMRAAITERA